MQNNKNSDLFFFSST